MQYRFHLSTKKAFRGLFPFLFLFIWVFSDILRLPFVNFPPAIPQAKAAVWYNASWLYRKPITIDYTKVSATLSNFPVLISLTSDTDLAADAQDDGDDILFTSSDGSTKLNHEIESFSGTTGALNAWVNVPTLSSSANTVLYMYYGNSGAASQQNATAVWDSNYKGVWHMKEDPSVTAPQMKDSTGNANHGTSQGSMTSAALVSAQVGNGLDFDNSNHYITIPTSTSLDITGAMTVETWVSMDDQTYASRFVSKNSLSSPNRGWELNYEIASPFLGLTTMRIFDDTDPGNVRFITSEAARLTTATWWHYAGVFEPSTAVRIYKNGSQSGANTTSIPATQKNNSSQGVWFARNPNLGSCSTCYLNGRLDEIRISNVARSSGWISTGYNNMSSPSTFFSLSGEEIPPTFEQSGYRLYANANSTDVGSVLANLNTAGSLTATGDAFRLRLLLHVGSSELGASGQTFKLQFAQKSGTCDTSFSGESYADVTGATVIAYKNNATPADGATLTDNANDPTHSTDTIVNQTYEEGNNFTNSVAAIPVGQDGLWDFALYDNGATASTDYCFRVLWSDDTQLNTYTVIPQITMAAAAADTLTFSLSDTSVGFGNLNASSARYATGDASGSDTEAVAHTLAVTTTADNGYVVYVSGSTLTKGDDTITAIGGASAASSAGSEQFGMRATASGTGTVSSPYNHASNYAYDGAATSDVIATGAGDNSQTTFSIRYLANITSITEAGAYSTELTFVAVGSF